MARDSALSWQRNDILSDEGQHGDNTQLTVWSLTDDEKMDKTEVKQHASFDEVFQKKIGSYDPEELEMFDNDHAHDATSYLSCLQVTQ